MYNTTAPHQALLKYTTHYTACIIIPLTKPLYKISSPIPLAIKFTMKTGKIAAAPIPAKALPDIEELFSIYANVFASTNCVKLKL